MATMPRYLSMFQINTRVWLGRLSREAGKPITLADIDDATLDGLAEKGFDWIWLLSVWQIGAAGRAVSRGNPQWRGEFQAVLPDLTEDDICGSGFAITGYTVNETLGGEPALAQFRERLARRGIKLMLDFVPNHTAPDHPWVKGHPDYYIEASEEALAAAPQNYLRVDTDRGPKILAYGRDPNFPGWPDTLQLNYAHPELQRARIDELTAIAGKCDGVRCDMAMLLLPEIFQRTWGLTPEPFWPKAIPAVRAKSPPGFTFMAEVYWDLEWTLQQQGFDYCYDKRLYDRLRDGHAGPIHGHLLAGLDYQDKLARFLENHDEPRAASEFPWPQHQAAAIITFLSPGLRFFHQGQFEGAHVRVPTHLCRGPAEPVIPEITAFYARLLQVLKTGALRDGAWSQIQPQPAWSGNPTSDDFIAYAWASDKGSRHVVAVNYADNQAQCRLPLPFPEFRGKQVRLTDLMGTEVHDGDGTELVDPGLFIDHGPWHFNVFALQAN
jgi:glycosidase